MENRLVTNDEILNQIVCNPSILHTIDDDDEPLKMSASYFGCGIIMTVCENQYIYIYPFSYIYSIIPF